MDRSFISPVIIDGLLLPAKHTVRHEEYKNEKDKHACPQGAKTLGDRIIKTSTCNAAGYSGTIKGI